MKSAVGNYWRESASLIVLAKRNLEALSAKDNENSNYDILLQTRPHTASYSNSVVFPGGVTEEADSDEHWLRLFNSFGYNELDFASLHKSNSHITPIFAESPVRRHIALRITAIRETFEELGFLICRTEHKDVKKTLWANIVSCNDIQYWQSRIKKNPLDLLNLCKEQNCYPDIWSLHYWSNWLTPPHLKYRFDTAFFVTALNTRDNIIRRNFKSDQEVVKAEWARPSDILHRNEKKEVELHPPQAYEFHRLNYFNDLEKLIEFAKQRSGHGNKLLHGVHLRARDGALFLFAGDYLYPTDVNYIEYKLIRSDKTVQELSDPTRALHRIQIQNKQKTLVIRNYAPQEHINMGNVTLPFNVTVGTKD